MAKKSSSDSANAPASGKPSALVDTRVIYCGDNLDQLKKLPEACVDLIYIDPPFNSNRNYEVFWGETQEKRAFEDRHASTQAYIEFMRPRCVELHRVLKETGSFYYHCDWHASHYVKVMLDQIFGMKQCQSEVVWRRTNARGDDRRWPRMHDAIFFYSREESGYTFHPLMLPGDESKMPHTLVTGPDGLKYNTSDLTGAGRTQEGESGEPWRGYDPSKFGRHWGYSVSQREEWDKAGLIHWPKKKGVAGGFPRKLEDRPFTAEARMVQAGDVWTDIDRLNQTSKERLGYPTQKPLALLERIINGVRGEGFLLRLGLGLSLVQPLAKVAPTVTELTPVRRGKDFSERGVALRVLRPVLLGTRTFVGGVHRDALQRVLEDLADGTGGCRLNLDATPRGGSIIAPESEVQPGRLKWGKLFLGQSAVLNPAVNQKVNVDVVAVPLRHQLDAPQATAQLLPAQALPPAQPLQGDGNAREPVSQPPKGAPGQGQRNEAGVA